MLCIPRSKTDPEGVGALLYLSPATMDKLRAIRPEVPDPTGPLFGGLDGAAIARRIRAAAVAAGLPEAERYSGHSPRVGMIVDLAAAGIDQLSITVAARHANPTTTARYLRATSARAGAVARYHSGRLAAVIEHARGEGPHA